MNRKANCLVALVAVLGLAAPAYSQGRHDEKPHGPPKNASAKKKQEVKQGMAGRHDERPHGPPKAAAPTGKKAADPDKK